MSRRIEDLAPMVQEKSSKFLYLCRRAEMPLIITCTYRSFEEQEALFAKGRSLPGPIVTHARAGDSYHNYRMAFDVCFMLPNYSLSWQGPWDKIAAIGRDLGLEWGGDFVSFPDRPHFQFSNGLSIATLKARYRLPEATHPESFEI